MCEWSGFSACSPAHDISWASVSPCYAAISVALQWHLIVVLGLHFSNGQWWWHLMILDSSMSSLLNCVSFARFLIEFLVFYCQGIKVPYVPLILSFWLGMWFASITSWSTVYIFILFLCRFFLAQEKLLLTNSISFSSCGCVCSSKHLRYRSTESYGSPSNFTCNFKV